MALIATTNSASGVAETESASAADSGRAEFNSRSVFGPLPAEGGDPLAGNGVAADQTGILADRDALTRFYRWTGGSGWANDSNWLSDKPLGEWRGVVTGPSGRVEMLLLRDNRLRGGIPEEIAQLESLRVLDLSGNSLSGKLPPVLGLVEGLQSLALARNAFAGSIPPELGSLAKLEYLNLSSNQLGGPIPPEIAGLSRLHALRVSGNQLTGEIPSDLWRLPEIAILDLSSNRLQGSLPPEIGNLHSLWELRLNGNRIAGPLPAELSRLRSLSVLNLRSNSISGSMPAGLGQLASLQELDLSRNELTGEIPPEIADMQRLRDLRLNSNRLSGQIPPGLDRISTLEVLFANGNQLTGMIPPELGRLANLSKLDVSANRLSGQIHPDLHRLHDLEILRLGRNRQFQGCLPRHWEDSDFTDVRHINLPYCPFGLPGIDAGPGRLQPSFDTGINDYVLWIASDVVQVTFEPIAAGLEIEFLDGQGNTLEDADSVLNGFQLAISRGKDLVRVRASSSDGSRRAIYGFEVRRVFPGKVIVKESEFFEALQHNVPNLAIEIDGRVLPADFLTHFHDTGGVERWGFPTSEVFILEADTLTQFYQRGIVDFHKAGSDWVMERRLAWDYLGGGLAGSQDLGVEPEVLNPHPGEASGPWGHKIANLAIDGTQVGFADFYHRLGGLSAFGFPKSDARVDTNAPGTLHLAQLDPGFIRQYFQAAVFEFHPGDPGDPVKLSLLGDWVRDQLVDDFKAHIAFAAADQLHGGRLYFPPTARAIGSDPRANGQYAADVGEFLARSSTLRLFEAGPSPNWSRRLYASQFDELTTRYLAGELRFTMPAHDWEIDFELQIRLSDPAGREISAHQYARSVHSPSGTVSSIFWVGLNSLGFWPPGEYRVDVTHEDVTIASKAFTIVPRGVPGSPDFAALRSALAWGHAPNTRDETAALLALADLQSADPSLAETLISWPWINSRIDDSNLWFLQALAALARIDAAAAKELASAAWLADGLSEAEAGFLEGAFWTDRARARFVIGGIAKDQELPEWRAMGSAAVDQIASQDAALYSRLVRQAWFTDGMDAADSARTAVLLRQRHNGFYFGELLSGPQPMTRRITTQHSDAIDLAVVWRRPSLPGLNPLDWMEWGIRYIERFLDQPWPQTRVPLLLEPRMELLDPENPPGGYWAGDYIAVGSAWGEPAFRQILTHELGHYYFRSSTVQDWLAESAPTYTDRIGRALVGKLTVSELHDWAQRNYVTACIQNDVKTVRDLQAALGDSGPWGTRFQRCYYVLGQFFLTRIQTFIGGDAVGAALGQILKIESETGMRATDAQILAIFRDAAPPHRIDAVTSLLGDVYGAPLAA